MTTVLHWYHISISIHALLAESDFDEDDPDNLWSISIHALLAESDAIGRRGRAARGNFYPRSPCGERLWVILPRAAVV